MGNDPNSLTFLVPNPAEGDFIRGLCSIRTCLEASWASNTVDSKKLEHGFRVIYSGVPSLGLAVISQLSGFYCMKLVGARRPQKQKLARLKALLKGSFALHAALLGFH